MTATHIISLVILVVMLVVATTWPLTIGAKWGWWPFGVG